MVCWNVTDTWTSSVITTVSSDILKHNSPLYVYNLELTGNYRLSAVAVCHPQNSNLVRSHSGLN